MINSAQKGNFDSMMISNHTVSTFHNDQSRFGSLERTNQTAKIINEKILKKFQNTRLMNLEQFREFFGLLG